MAYTNYLASTYGSGAYDSSTYNGSTTTSTGAGSGSLVDTGAPVLLFSLVAFVIIILALVTVIAQRHKTIRAKAAQAAKLPPTNKYGEGNF